MRAGVGRRLPAELAHPGHMDEKAIRAEFPFVRERIEGGLHSEGADDMQSNRQV